MTNDSSKRKPRWKKLEKGLDERILGLRSYYLKQCRPYLDEILEEVKETDYGLAESLEKVVEGQKPFEKEVEELHRQVRYRFAPVHAAEREIREQQKKKKKKEPEERS